MPSAKSWIRIVEVGPRDGLQNETVQVPTETKIAFIDALSASEVDEIEVSAFVSARRVPQLADAPEVFGGISRQDGVVYSALVPNLMGLDRAVEARVDKVAVFTAASETFTRRNINASIAESLQRFTPVAARARREGLPLRGYLSTAFWCAFEGKIAPRDAVAVSEKLFDLGACEVSISDTVGKATPDEVKRLLDLLLKTVSPEKIAMHFHDTYGKAVANVLAARSYGIRTFDASVGGLGGCPFAPGATGNVATEDLVEALATAGETLRVNPSKLLQARRVLDAFVNDPRRPLPENDLPACAACEFASGDVCCERRR